uniref:GEM-interacting protein-like protein n=1 Tax=Callorhinchus milii TaxID=7868 RepID=V9KWB9_CALMI
MAVCLPAGGPSLGKAGAEGAFAIPGETSLLTCTVKKFAESLGRFKEALFFEGDGDMGLKLVLRRMEELLQVVEGIINLYPGLNHNHSLDTATAVLANRVTDLSTDGREDVRSHRYSDIFHDLDALELSFGNATIDLFMNEAERSPPGQDPSPVPDTMSKQEIGSECRANGVEREQVTAASVRAVQEADEMLVRCEGGVDTALLYAKLWCKYTKDLLSWLERHLALEMEFAKGIIKNAEAAKSQINQEKFMPFQYVYTLALEYEMKHGHVVIDTGTGLQINKYIQPLSQRRNELERCRKEFKEQWQREQRKMGEALSALRKARQVYWQRCEELQRGRQEETPPATVSTNTTGSSGKQLEKRKRLREEAHSKVEDAESGYKRCVSDANLRRCELERLKTHIIINTRKLIHHGDLTLKTVSMNLFGVVQDQRERLPLTLQSLCEGVRSYEPGLTYLQFLHQRQLLEHSPEPYQFEEFTVPNKR